MATWNYISKLSGYYTSQPILISLDGDGVISNIDWDATVPIDCRLIVLIDVSFDGGFNWEGWTQATNGGGIPHLKTATSISNAYLKYRVVMESNAASSSPVLHEINFFIEPVVEFENKGDDFVKPEIWIEKVGNGDFSIINITNANEEFKFTDLIDEEHLYVNSEREEILTSIPNKYRYSDFNDTYLNFPYGKNILKIQGSARFWFRHQFAIKQG